MDLYGIPAPGSEAADPGTSRFPHPLDERGRQTVTLGVLLGDQRLVQFAQKTLRIVPSRPIAPADAFLLHRRGDGVPSAAAAQQRDIIAIALGDLTGRVAFVGGSPDFPRLESAPLNVGPVLQTGIFSQRTAVLTSATIPSSLGARVGLEPGDFDEIDVGSPFDYEANALLYCGVHLPDPRTAAFGPAVHDELVALINAAGGRTLALFTSYKAMDAAAEAVRARGVEIVSSGDLVQRFEAAWSSAQLESHHRAAAALYRIKDRAFDRARHALATAESLSEFALQQEMVRWFDEEHLVSDSAPVVAVEAVT